MIKKLMPSIILLIILIIGVGYAYSQDFFMKKETAPVEAKLWTAIDVNRLQQITVRSPESENEQNTATDTANEQTERTLSAARSSSSEVHLKQVNGQWTMTAPADYPLNTYRVEEWLNVLQEAGVHDIVEEAPTDVSKYGLHPEHPTIELTETDGQRMALSIGDELPTQGYYYARLNNGPVVQLAEQTVNDLSGSAFYFMDTTPMGWDDTQLHQLSWKSKVPQASWTLTHSAISSDPGQDKWELDQQSIRADQAASITDAIKNIPTDTVPIPAEQVRSYSQVLTLTAQLIVDGQSTTHTYTGWQEPDNPAIIWMVDPAGKWAYRLPAQSIQVAADSPNNRNK